MIFFQQIRFSTDNYLTAVISTIDNSLKVISHAEQFGTREYLDSILDYIKEKHEISELKIAAEESQSCRFPEYEIQGFVICWHGLTVSATRNLDLIESNKVVKVVIAALFLSFKFSTIIIILSLILTFYLLWMFKRLPRDLHKKVTEPIAKINSNIVANDQHLYEGEIKELANLSKAIYFSKRKINQNIDWEALRSVAHDLKKPLHMSYTFARRLVKIAENKGHDAYINSSLVSLQAHVISGRLTIDNLLDPGFEPKLDKKIVYIEDIIEEIKCTFLGQISFISKACVYEKLAVDKHKLLRALNNIIINAIEASLDSQKDVTFSCLRRRRWLEFVVVNKGSFIEAKNLSQIINGSYHSRKKNGNGLGISIAKNFVHAHKGQLVLESNGVRSDGRNCDEKFEHDYVKCALYLPKS